MNRITLTKELIQIMTFVLQRKSQDSAELLRAELIAVLDQFPKNLPQTDAEPFRYALTAWIDDDLMNTDWQGQSQWCQLSLQQHYFSDHTAGDNFFTRLNHLRQQGLRNLDAVLIYYLCIEMGFLGCYRLSNRSLCTLIANDCAEFLSPLLPNGRAPWQEIIEHKTSRKRFFVTDITLIIFIIFMLATLIYLHYSLFDAITQTENFLRSRL